jgi:hypothetical protein
MKIRLDHALVAVAASAALAALLPSCGGGSTPSKPSTPSTLPSATPTPVAGSCALGAGSVSATCEVETTRLSPRIETAIDLVIREKPSLLDLNDAKPPNTDHYRVLDEEGFLDAVVENLRRQLLCAERDGDSPGLRRVVVKDSNAYSETFDLLENGYIRRREAAYVDTCTPAAFPIDRDSPDVPPAGSGCGRPYPPAISRFHCKVHLRGPEFYTVDATPMVGPNIAYCSAIGYQNQSICPVRREGAEDREACENWRVGRAKDTGRFGPTWTTAAGIACTGPESNCSNAPDNQYQARVYRSGSVKATAESGADCTLQVDR